MVVVVVVDSVVGVLDDVTDPSGVVKVASVGFFSLHTAFDAA